MSKMKPILRYLSGVPAVFMLLLIFAFSSQDGSSSGSLSYKVGYALNDCFNRIFSLGLSEAELAKRALSGQLIIRKLAHITEYFLLTLSFYLPLRVWLPYKKINLAGRNFFYRLLLPTFLLGLCSAAADEFHQSFVPGRCGTPLDVLVDSVGITVGCILLALCHHFFNRKKQHR